MKFGFFSYGFVILNFLYFSGLNLIISSKWNLVTKNWEFQKTENSFSALEKMYSLHKAEDGVAEYMAIQYWYINRCEEAISVLEIRHQQDCNQRFHSLLGKWYEETGDSISALRNLEMSHFITPHLLQSRMDLALFFQRHQNKPMAKYWANEILNYPIKVQQPRTNGLKEQAGKIYFSD